MDKSKMWEICQEVRLGNLSEQEATDQICQLIEPKYNSVIISKLPRRKRPDLILSYEDESILVTRGNEHPEERTPLYKPMFFQTNETGTSYRKIAQVEHDEGGLLTDEDKDELVKDYPLLDFSFEDDYKAEVKALLKAQDAKTASIFKAKCEACADGFISTHEKATNEIRAIKDAECQVRIERIKREIEKRGLVTRPDGTITEDVETVIEIDDMDWWQEFWKQEGG